MTSASRPPTIFIAEDNPVLLQGLDQALTAHGYRCETAEDGGALMDRLVSAPVPPDLLLLDVMMPVMTGLEVVSALRRDPRFAELPVMLITAVSGGQGAPEIPRDDSVDMLIKPFRLYDLLSRIATQLDRRRAVRAAPVQHEIFAREHLA